MSLAATHYEQAFEHYLQQCRLPYVAVDQAKKAVFADVRLKSFDFIVYGRQSRCFLVDVKGRKFPRSQFEKGRWGQNWVTADDVDGLMRWQEIFGGDYVALFVFAYWLCDDWHGRACMAGPPRDRPTGPRASSSNLFETVFNHGQRDYFFAGVQLDAYRRHMKPRSPKWRTVYVPARHFGQLVRPFSELMPPGR